MQTFFTVDRAGLLRENLEISLTKHQDIKPQELQLHSNSLYPDGVSFHGATYLIKPNSRGNISSPAIELLFEYVRRSNFPQMPSRFQSFFACATLAEAQQFRVNFGRPEQQIWTVYSQEDSFRVNMKLLDNNQTTLYCSYLAHEYWQGNAGPTQLGQFWEMILRLPVKIGQRVS